MDNETFKMITATIRENERYKLQIDLIKKEIEKAKRIADDVGITYKIEPCVYVEDLEKILG